jgi:hypothetical protein
MTERDIVILFGAGASHGACYVHPEAPPLGAGLYDALAVLYPNAWGSESHLGKLYGQRFRHDFELAMFQNVLPSEPSLSLLESHRHIASFFARYSLSGGGRDVYTRLVSELSAEELLPRVTLASLNYDCLLEHAISDLGLVFDYMLEDLSSEGSIPLAKIHGSCNFITPDLSSMRAHLTNANASSIECSITPLPTHQLQDCLQRKFSRHGPDYFPVLGLYSPDKPSIVAPAKLQHLRNILAQRIRRATAVILVGLKPNTQRDPHLWEPIEQTKASTILYIGGEGDYQTLQTRQPKTIHVARTFADSVSAIIRTLSKPL